MNAPMGAMARVTTRETVPLLPTSKVTVTECPTRTDPTSTTVLETARRAIPVTAVPETGSPSDPWSVEMVILEGYEPATGGSNRTEKVTDCCRREHGADSGQAAHDVGSTGAPVPGQGFGVVHELLMVMVEGLPARSGQDRAEGQGLGRHQEPGRGAVARERDRPGAGAGRDREGGDYRSGAGRCEGDPHGDGRPRREVGPEAGLADAERRRSDGRGARGGYHRRTGGGPGRHRRGR